MYNIEINCKKDIFDTCEAYKCFINGLETLDDGSKLLVFQLVGGDYEYKVLPTYWTCKALLENITDTKEGVKKAKKFIKVIDGIDNTKTMIDIDELAKYNFTYKLYFYYRKSSAGKNYGCVAYKKKDVYIDAMQKVDDEASQKLNEGAYNK